MSRPNALVTSQVNVSKLPSIVVLTTSQPPVAVALHPDTPVVLQVNASRNTDDGDTTIDSTGKTKSVKRNK